MLEHVLVSLDGSKLAEEAIEPAKQIIRPNGKITLVTAIDIPQSWVYSAYPTIRYEESADKIDLLMQQARAYLDEIAAQLRSDHFRVETIVQVGEAATLIIETAAGRDVDAIVMCTHGRSGISRWLFGSVTGKVLSTAPCPVFVIPNRQQESREVDAERRVESWKG